MRFRIRAKRKIILFAIVFISLNSFSQATNTKDTIISISYSSFGKASTFNMKIDSREIAYEETYRRSEETKKFCKTITARSWKKIIKCISEINLKKLNSIKSPTNDREVDGALYAQLSIHTSAADYKTLDFDEGAPMKEIKGLFLEIDKIIARKLVDDKYAERIRAKN